ncbi:MAG: hypothetical protein NTZ01_00245, partial [Verrucomicrobia bacterium]|nr:hypothetical protein [Verrucomicrobiota bacterium]
QMQGVGLLANNNLTAFLNPKTLAGTNSSASYQLNTMTLGGFLNTMQFSTLITAISQKNSANVLANPSIVLKRGQQGKISSIQEFRYVKEYSDPQSSVAQIVLTGGTTVPGPETVIGSFPSQISDMVPIGVEMGVKPDVIGGDSRVLLELQPSFVDFEGNINYGAEIFSSYASRPFGVIPPAASPVPILTNTINQPVFIKRDLKLPPVDVADGYTILLGGLLREDIQKIDEKIPILGDIPLIGRAFTGKTEQAIKKNTLIFVTPRRRGLLPPLRLIPDGSHKPPVGTEQGPVGLFSDETILELLWDLADIARRPTCQIRHAVSGPAKDEIKEGAPGVGRFRLGIPQSGFEVGWAMDREINPPSACVSPDFDFFKRFVADPKRFQVRARFRGQKGLHLVLWSMAVPGCLGGLQGGGIDRDLKNLTIGASWQEECLIWILVPNLHLGGEI